MENALKSAKFLNFSRKTESANYECKPFAINDSPSPVKKHIFKEDQEKPTF